MMSRTHKEQPFLPLLVCVLTMACAGKKSEWDIDYSSVYKAYGNREIDSGYKAPSVISCVDDDLYNCR